MSCDVEKGGSTLASSNAGSCSSFRASVLRQNNSMKLCESCAGDRHTRILNQIWLTAQHCNSNCRQIAHSLASSSLTHITSRSPQHSKTPPQRQHPHFRITSRISKSLNSPPVLKSSIPCEQAECCCAHSQTSTIQSRSPACCSHPMTTSRRTRRSSITPTRALSRSTTTMARRQTSTRPSRRVTRLR